jgi:hypothetical protein
MPKKIILPAHFKVCENCGHHGHIVFSDGSEGKEVASESDALAQLEQARKDGKLLDIEVGVVRKQILDSPLSSSSMLPIVLLSLLSSALSEIVPNDPVSRRSAMDKIHLN